MVPRGVGATTPTLLLAGETGLGREVIARALHSTGPRCCQPFLAINCAALYPTPSSRASSSGTSRGRLPGRSICDNLSEAANRSPGEQLMGRSALPPADRPAGD